MGAHPPSPLPGDLRHLHPLSHPRWLRVRQGFGSHSWPGFQSGLLAPILVSWGDTPKPPAMGLRPLYPSFAHPRWLRVRQGFGSHSWRGFQSGLLAPSFGFVGGHPPDPRRGLAPPGPHLPTLVSSGFAGVLGPTRGGAANVGNSPPLLVLWGETPQPPRHGGSAPLDPPFCPPSLA